MRLKHITFTGIDERTDFSVLRDIQRKYPLAEFGVLTSYHWNENGNRYLNPDEISRLQGYGLNLSLHLCGSAAHDAAVGDWDKVIDLTRDKLHIFKRCQLNIAGMRNNPSSVWMSPIIGQEIIVQQKDAEHIDIYRETLKRYPFYEPFSVLLDASGGRGIDTPIQVLKGKVKVGYAGGINPNNVAEKLKCLLDSPNEGDCWIDMESGVRTEDWFDVGKVLSVLEICDNIVKEYENH